MAEATALCAYIASREDGGGLERSSEELWHLIVAAWGIESQPRLQGIGVIYQADAATKRMGVRSAKKDHNLLMFPNTQHTVLVEAAGLGRFMDSVPTGLDYMSFIETARTITLIEGAVSGQKSVVLGWAFKPDVLVEQNMVTYESTNTDNLEYFRANCQGTISGADQSLVASLELLGGETADDDDELMRLAQGIDPILIPGEEGFARQGLSTPP